MNISGLSVFIKANNFFLISLSDKLLTYFAAKKFKSGKIIDPRKYAVGSIKQVYKKFSLGPVLPAMGYGKKQIKELEKTINAVPCDTVVIATPFDLASLMRINTPSVRVFYELKEKGRVKLKNVIP